MKRAGFLIRLGAALLDLAILAVLTLVGGSFLGAVTGYYGALDHGHETDESILIGFLGGLLGPFLALPFLAFPYFLVEAFTGRTVGKLILGLQIAAARGSAATTGQLLARWLLKCNAFLLGLVAALADNPWLWLLTGAGAAVAVIGCFFALGDAHQALHDRSAGTAVFSRADLERGLVYAEPDDWRSCGEAAPSEASDDWREVPEKGDWRDAPASGEDDDSWRNA